MKVEVQSYQSSAEPVSVIFRVDGVVFYCNHLNTREETDIEDSHNPLTDQHYTHERQIEICNNCDAFFNPQFDSWDWSN